MKCLTFFLCVCLFSFEAYSSSYMYSGNNYNFSNQYKGALKKKSESEKKDTFSRYISFKVNSIFSNHPSSSIRNQATGQIIPSTSEYENNYGFSLAYGAKTKYKNIWIEGEIGYDSYPLERNLANAIFLFNRDIDLINGMANAYYMYDNKTKFTPYVGLGAGFSVLKRTNDFGFGYQFKAGVDWDFNSRYSIGLNYRFFGSTKFTTELINGLGQPQEEEISMRSSMIQLGLKYRF